MGRRTVFGALASVTLVGVVSLVLAVALLAASTGETAPSVRSPVNDGLPDRWFASFEGRQKLGPFFPTLEWAGHATFTLSRRDLTIELPREYQYFPSGTITATASVNLGEWYCGRWKRTSTLQLTWRNGWFRAVVIRPSGKKTPKVAYELVTSFLPRDVGTRNFATLREPTVWWHQPDCGESIPWMSFSGGHGWVRTARAASLEWAETRPYGSIRWCMARKPSDLESCKGDELEAVARISGSTLRASTRTLDGSQSKGEIKSYEWSFEPVKCTDTRPGACAGSCDAVGPKPGARKRGERVTIKPLCTVAAKLTVSDGSKTDSATVTVPVTPREFKTPPVKHRELLRDDRVSDPPFVHPGGNYGINLGLNVAACDEKSTGRPMLCPPLRTVGGTLTGLGGRYTFARVDDGGGPFDGFFYVATAPITIDRIGILNFWVLPGSPQFVAGQPNFWDYNSTHAVAVGGANQAVDLAALRAAMSAHEGMGIPGQLSTGHSGRLQAWINDEDSDPRRAIEGMFDPSQRTLQRQVDQKLAGVSTDLFVATKDPLPVIWRGQAWFYDREDSIWRQDELTIGG